MSSSDNRFATEMPTSLSRERLRSRRKRAIRAHTTSVKRMTKTELAIGRALYPDDGHAIPSCRGECASIPRPCPYVSCRHHLYVDVSEETGSVKFNFPDLEVWEMTESCALDVADRGGATLENVGAIMNLTRERIRQLERKAEAKLAALREMETLREYVQEVPRRPPVLTVVEEQEAEAWSEEAWRRAEEEQDNGRQD